MKDKTVAALLALFMGGLGIQFFYLGRGLAGVLSILFSWTFIPAIIGFFHGILLLLGSQESFDAKYNPGKKNSAEIAELRADLKNLESSFPGGDRYAALDRLHSLKEKGAINEEQYEQEKLRLLG